MPNLFACAEEPDYDIDDRPPIVIPGTVEANAELDAQLERARADALRRSFGTKPPPRRRIPKDAKAALFGPSLIQGRMKL